MMRAHIDPTSRTTAVSSSRFCTTGRCAIAVLLLAATLAVASGCAYFNTMYNANRAYRDAQSQPRNPDGTVNRNAATDYDKVIEKCQYLIANYPKSKHVDDALLLMGKSYHEKGEYDDAVIKFEELESNFPKSKLNEEGQLYLAKSLVADDNPEQAILVLKKLREKHPKSKYSDEILFLLGTNLIRTDQEAEAVQYLQVLTEKYSKSEYRVTADLEIADIYLERGEYEKSLAIYEELWKDNLKTEDRVRSLNKLSEVYVKIGRYQSALDVFAEIDKFVLDDQTRAVQLLLRGSAYAGMDSIPKAIDTYKSVTASFPRSMYSAEAFFHLGVIYQEKLDSLDVAQTEFDNVPRQYSNSDFAQEAIRRSVSISKLKKIRASLESGGEESEEVKVAAQFDLAEIQLFQFDNYQQALDGYQKILADFPDSETAPKAAYAIAYIYEDKLKDPDKARQAYEFLVNNYPQSEQATHARRYLQIAGETDSPPQ